MAELQPAVLFRYENWIHAVSQSESANEARIDVNVSFTGYKYWTLIFSQRATKGNGSRYQDGFVIGMSGGNNDAQNWIAQLEDLDFKLIRRNNFTAADNSTGYQQWGSSNCYYSYRHKYEDLVTYKFVCDVKNKRMYCYMNEIYLGYGPLNFPTTQYPNGRLEVLKTWAQLGDSNCISYLGDVWLYGTNVSLGDAKNYKGGEVDHRSSGTFLVHHSSHESGRKMVSDQSGRMYGWVLKVDPYTPPVPPDPPGWKPTYMRLRYTNGVTPTFSRGTARRISTSPNVWEVVYEDPNWYSMFQDDTNLIAVVSGNTSRITNMSAMFQGCTNLTSVAVFDTSNVTTMGSMFKTCTNLTTAPLLNTANVSYFRSMFSECDKLTSVPLLDLTSATNMDTMFWRCTKVQSGALALYQRASSTGRVTDHYLTFFRCGSDTTTGAAELAQIPSTWK